MSEAVEVIAGFLKPGRYQVVDGGRALSLGLFAGRVSFDSATVDAAGSYGDSAVKSGLAAAAGGALLFGGVGALAGAAIGTKGVAACRVAWPDGRELLLRGSTKVLTDISLAAQASAMQARAGVSHVVRPGGSSGLRIFVRGFGALLVISGLLFALESGTAAVVTGALGAGVWWLGGKIA